MSNIPVFMKVKDLYLLGQLPPARIEGSLRRYSCPEEITREEKLTDIVERGAGGRICVEFSEDDRPLYACIVEVPEENLDRLLEPPVAVVYTGPLPRVRKNDPELKLAAKVWNGFREDYGSQPQQTPPAVGKE